MKLKAIWIEVNELQDYLDKYQDKIKFMFHWEQYNANIDYRNKICLVIDEA
jgi:hypothetical protein